MFKLQCFFKGIKMNVESHTTDFKLFYNKNMPLSMKVHVH